jgi:hypothetical protein
LRAPLSLPWSITARLRPPPTPWTHPSAASPLSRRSPAVGSAPPVSPRSPPSRPPPLWQAGPACQLPPLAHDMQSTRSPPARAPPRRLAITPPSEPWRLAALSLAPAPSYPVTPLPEPSRRNCAPFSPLRQASLVCATSPPSPSRLPIKGPPQAPDSTTPGLSHSTFLPWTQSSSPPPSLPSLVSSALPPLLSSSQVSVVVDLRHFTASTTHPFPSPIALLV